LWFSGFAEVGFQPKLQSRVMALGRPNQTWF
jgi:hypothetical protein